MVNNKNPLEEALQWALKEYGADSLPSTVRRKIGNRARKMLKKQVGGLLEHYVDFRTLDESQKDMLHTIFSTSLRIPVHQGAPVIDLLMQGFVSQEDLHLQFDLFYDQQDVSRYTCIQDSLVNYRLWVSENSSVVGVAYHNFFAFPPVDVTDRLCTIVKDDLNMLSAMNVLVKYGRMILDSNYCPTIQTIETIHESFKPLIDDPSLLSQYLSFLRRELKISEGTSLSNSFDFIVANGSLSSFVNECTPQSFFELTSGQRKLFVGLPSEQCSIEERLSSTQKYMGDDATLVSTVIQSVRGAIRKPLLAAIIENQEYVDLAMAKLRGNKNSLRMYGEAILQHDARSLSLMIAGANSLENAQCILERGYNFFTGPKGDDLVRIAQTNNHARWIFGLYSSAGPLRKDVILRAEALLPDLTLAHKSIVGLTEDSSAKILTYDDAAFIQAMHPGTAAKKGSTPWIEQVMLSIPETERDHVRRGYATIGDKCKNRMRQANERSVLVAFSRHVSEYGALPEFKLLLADGDLFDKYLQAMGQNDFHEDFRTALSTPSPLIAIKKLLSSKPDSSDSQPLPSVDGSRWTGKPLSRIGIFGGIYLNEERSTLSDLLRPRDVFVYDQWDLDKRRSIDIIRSDDLVILTTGYMSHADGERVRIACLGVGAQFERFAQKNVRLLADYAKMFLPPSDK